MKHKTLLYTLAVLPSLVLLSCQPPTLEKGTPGINEVKTGAKFKVVLPEDHIDGYTWQLNEDFDKSVIEAMDPAWHGKEKGIYFYFKALYKGQTTLTFVKRKFTDTSHIQSFIVKVSQ
jgi:predicted secreted protein